MSLERGDDHTEEKPRANFAIGSSRCSSRASRDRRGARRHVRRWGRCRRKRVRRSGRQIARAARRQTAPAFRRAHRDSRRPTRNARSSRAARCPSRCAPRLRSSRDAARCNASAHTTDHALGAGQQSRGIAAPGVVQVAHLSGVAAREPFLEARGIRQVFGCCDSTKIETDRRCVGDHPIGFRPIWHVHDSALARRSRKGSARGGAQGRRAGECPGVWYLWRFVRDMLW